jgi:hypothetical protein
VVVDPENATLASQDVSMDASANVTTPLFVLPVSDLFAAHPLLFVRLELRDAAGALIADNFYWVARDAESYRGLDQLAMTSIDSSVAPEPQVLVDGATERVWRVHLCNSGKDAAIALKLTLHHADGTRILPAYYSDNYVSLLPGEEREITIQAPAKAAGTGVAAVSLRGWNLPEESVPPGSTAAVSNLTAPAKAPVSTLKSTTESARRLNRQ